MGVASLVLGIISLVLGVFSSGLLGWLGAILAIVGIIYDGLSPEEFFRLAGQRCRQIGKLYEDVMENLR